MSLRTADDADAFLAFEAIDEECADASDSTIGFGLLAESETTFAELVDVRNNGTRTVTSLWFDFDADGADQPNPRVEDALRVVSDGTDIGNATTELPPEN